MVLLSYNVSLQQKKRMSLKVNLIFICGGISKDAFNQTYLNGALNMRCVLIFLSFFSMLAFSQDREQLPIHIGAINGVKDTALQSLALIRDSEGAPTMVFLTTRNDEDTIVIRCVVKHVNNVETCVGEDYVKLAKYGHGESLEVMENTSNPDSVYLWIGSGANSDSNHWSTSITGGLYKWNTINDNSTVDKATFEPIRSLAFKRYTFDAKDTHPTTNQNEEVRRLAFAFSTQSIAIRARKGRVNTYAYYNNLEPLTPENVWATLISKKNITIKSVADGVDSVTYTINEDGNNITKHSFQSMDINKGCFHISGGHAGITGKVNRFNFKYRKTDHVEPLEPITTVETSNGAVDIATDGSMKILEIEGIKVYHDKIFYLLKPSSGNDFQHTKLFSFPRTYLRIGGC